MGNLIDIVNSGLVYHFKENLSANDVLQGDKIIFEAFINASETEEELDLIALKTRKKIDNHLPIFNSDKFIINSDNLIDQNINNIINNFENDLIKHELKRLNSSSKKQIRAKMFLELAKDYTTASLIELFHLATLIQDDVIDNAVVRRHSMTINQKYDNKIAILISDVVMVEIITKFKKYANEILTETIVHENKNIAKLYKDYMNLLISNMIDGELTANLVNSKTSYEKYAIKKTGNLFGYVLMLSKLACDRENVNYDEAIDIFNYGVSYGLLFQKVDDYVDLFGDVKISGKNQMDSNNNIYSFTSYHQDQKSMLEELNLDIENLQKNEYSKIYNKYILDLKRRINE